MLSYISRVFWVEAFVSMKRFIPPVVASLIKRNEKHMYAIVETGGKQYKVAEGDVVYVEKLDVEENAKVKLDKVLAVGTDKGLKVGAPYVKGATVEAKAVKNGKAKKVVVFTYKPKKNEKRKMGHRQPYTKLEITKISEKAPRAAKAKDTEAEAAE